eukprot:gene31656-6853_t
MQGVPPQLGCYYTTPNTKGASSPGFRKKCLPL